MALFEHGLTCLDETGWHTFDETNSPLRGNLHQIITCPADYFLILHTFGLTLFDGEERWLEVPADGLPGFPDRAGCDGQNNLWLSHWNGVSVHDGQAWQTYPLEEISTGADYGYIQDLAVSPEGELWVLLDHARPSVDETGWFAEMMARQKNYF
jgi:ligand-binding sensor domain-containing protein